MKHRAEEVQERANAEAKYKELQEELEAEVGKNRQVSLDSDKREILLQKELSNKADTIHKYETETYSYQCDLQTKETIRQQLELKVKQLQEQVTVIERKNK